MIPTQTRARNAETLTRSGLLFLRGFPLVGETFGGEFTGELAFFETAVDYS